jgi:hypothetical protein
VTEDIQEIMEQPPVEGNHGQSVGTYVDESGSPQVARRDLAGRLASVDQKGLDTGDSRFGIVVGKDEGGLVAHRGVLQEDEYVDPFLLRDAVEAELGFSYADVTAAYRKGRPTAEQRQLREKVDARLLALSRAGGNMDQLSKALGLPERTLDSALARAREIDVQPMVPQGVVKSTFACFKCGEPGRKQKRRFSQSPAQWVGTVVLCEEHHAAGFVTKPGDPAYWEFREARTPLRGRAIGPSTRREQRFPMNYPDDESYRNFIEGERAIA